MPVQSSKKKRIVVIIASYNNAAYYEQNLVMLLAQNCPDFEFIALYFEDASTDNTYELVKTFLEKYDIHHRVHLIHNDNNRGSLANTMCGILWCKNSDIVVCYDGDDFFPHTHVLEHIHNLYKDPTTCATYGQYMEFPSNRLGNCRQVPSEVINANGWRDFPLPLATSHLRTFYAGLGKQISFEDLYYNNKLLSTSCDLGFFWPILEMCGHYAKFVPEILYVYRETDINDYKLRLPLMIEIYKYMQQKKRYTPLSLEEIQKIIAD
jgi:glycosyltransferase involved in cell wall biosynthesis